MHSSRARCVPCRSSCTAGQAAKPVATLRWSGAGHDNAGTYMFHSAVVGGSGGLPNKMLASLRTQAASTPWSPTPTRLLLDTLAPLQTASQCGYLGALGASKAPAPSLPGSGSWRQCPCHLAAIHAASATFLHKCINVVCYWVKVYWRSHVASGVFPSLNPLPQAVPRIPFPCRILPYTTDQRQLHARS
jgi:hypothetical protein